MAGSADIANLQQQLNVDKVVSQLLVQRNIKTFEEARLFFRPELSQLHDPFLMKGMNEAIARINLAY